MIIAMIKRRNGINFTTLTKPFLPSTSHYLLYVAIIVQAVGIANILRIAATTRSIVLKVPVLITVPSHMSAVIKTNGIANLFIESLECLYFSTVVSRSV